MEENYLLVPKITVSIRIDEKLHVRLFHNSCTILFHSSFEIKVSLNLKISPLMRDRNLNINTRKNTANNVSKIPT